MTVERFPDGTAEIPFPHKVFHWQDGKDSMTIEMRPGGWFDAPPCPKIEGWKCHFHAHFGAERVEYSYKRVAVEVAA